MNMKFTVYSSSSDSSDSQYGLRIVQILPAQDREMRAPGNLGSTVFSERKEEIDMKEESQAETRIYSIRRNTNRISPKHLDFVVLPPYP